MKVKKTGALILAGVLTCTTPEVVFAEDTAAAEEMIMDEVVDSLLSDPDKVADIIIFVKDMVDQQDLSDEELLNLIDEAVVQFNVDLSDSDKESILSLVKKFKDMDIDEEQLRENISSAYDKLESLGVDKESVKGILGKLIDFAKSILNENIQNA